MFKRFLLAILVLIIVVIVAGYFAFGYIAKQAIQTAGPQLLGVPVSVDSVSLSLVSGQLEVNGLTIANPKGYQGNYALQVDQIRVQAPISQLLESKIVINEVLISEPQINYQLGLGGSNIGQIVNNTAKPAQHSQRQVQSQSATGDDATKVVVKQLNIEKAKVTGRISILKAGVTIPAIRLTNVGEQSGGASVAYVVRQVMLALVSSLGHVGIDAVNGVFSGAFKGAKGVVSDTGSIVKQGATGAADAVGKAGSTVGDAVGGAVKSVKGLFN